MEPLSVRLPSSMQLDTVEARTLDMQRHLDTMSRQGEANVSELQQQLSEFASLLIFQMLQAMRQTVPHSPLLDSGFAHDLYLSFLDQEVAQQVSRRGDLGLIALLQQQFEQQAMKPPSQAQTAHGLAAYQRHLSHDPRRFTMPVQGLLTSGFGQRQDPFTHQQDWHHGIDIAAPEGTLIQAAAPGHVVFDGTLPGYGNVLIIDHQDGYQTYYAHTSENLVRSGDEVEQAQPIARVGATGRATGPHVHFEVRQHGQAIDPLPTLSGMASPPNNL